MLAFLMTKNVQRGQTFPIWIGSILITLSFAFVLANYANVVMAQVKAQNAADSAASAVVAVQSQQWNLMEEILYASALEEYRLRHLLEGIRISAQLSGGCNVTTSCPQVYANLTHAYSQSVYRYDNDLQLLSRVTKTMTFAHMYSDGYTMLQRLSAGCGSSTSSDCGLTFALSGYTVRNAVGEVNIYPSAQMLVGPGAGLTSAVPDYFGPITAEVSVCSRVDPMFKNVWILGALPAVTVVARGAATNAMVVQDWIQPGTDINPSTGSVYQPTEVYGDPASDGTNWYAVNYGGNTVSANASTGQFLGSINNDEFSARLGWWGPMPVYPFSGPQTVDQLFGSQAGSCK
jgi:hypothetical protein